MAIKRDFTEYSEPNDRGSPTNNGDGAAPPSSPPGIPFDYNDDDDEDEDDDIDEVRVVQNLDTEDEEEIVGDEDESSGEELIDTAMNDYGANLAQDQYDLEADDIDDQEYEAMDIGERRKVDAMLRARAEGRDMPTLDGGDSSGRGDTFVRDEGDEYNEENDLFVSTNLPINRRFRNQFDENEMDDENPDNDDDEEDGRYLTSQELSDVKAPSVVEWITQPMVHRSIAHYFHEFLVTYTDTQGRSIYRGRIGTLVEQNKESLEVNYQHLAEAHAVLTYFLVLCPAEMLKIFDTVAMDVVVLEYPHFKRIHPEIYVRMTDLPVPYTLRELREHHLNTLIRLTGVVTRRTGVFPQLKWVKFDCLKCGQILGPFVQDAHQEVKLNYCSNCQSRGPFTINRQETIYRNYQRMTVQESPGTVPAGRLPRHRDVIMLADMIDSAKPGDEVDITGIYRNAFDASLNVRSGFPVFSTVIEANNVLRRDSGRIAEIHLSEIEANELRGLAAKNGHRMIDEIVAAICPSIFGHVDAKTALACALFGGVPKSSGKVSLRGDINVLMLGDPGTAKSQLLKYSEMTSSRAVFATGQGASAVGLTASVRKDTVTREWTLEGGALVLADRGMCIIDEFDKMNDQDRTSIHEAMEQQSISVSKAGIVANLQARCAVVAAANPRYGRYNASETLMSNVDLTEPILSRFDVVCIIQDLVRPEHDKKLASWVVKNHARASASQLNEELPPDDRPKPKLSQDLLRKYIYYARENCTPRFGAGGAVNDAAISELYQELRRESAKTGSFPVTVRHLESIIRLSESFARMRLSDIVDERDVKRAMALTVNTFVNSQKFNQRRALRANLARFLV